MSLALQEKPTSRAAVNPWLIAVAVVIPTFMEVLDTTIANVALRYIAGGLSAAENDSEWIITSYLAANATILPISGWLAMRLGRRNYFLLSIAIFTIASVMCGVASSLEMLIWARVLQGLAGGGLQPSSQGILLDAFPQDKQGAAQALFGIAALLAPIVGPTLGGYITDNYGWRWIFYINLPVGVISLLICSALVRDPKYLNLQRLELRQRRAPFDTLGLVLLAATMTSWEVVLSKGQEWDWFGDPFWRIQTLTAVFAISVIALIVRETQITNPLINFRTLADRNFAMSCLLIFSAFGVLYANTTTLPALLQTLFGYDATTSGLVLSPAGAFSVVMLFAVGAMLTRGLDARYLVATGLLAMAAGNYWMSQLNLDVGPWNIVWPRVVIVVGLSMVFAPLNVAAFLYIPKELRGAAVGLIALLRNEGGSVGTSAAKIVLDRGDQFHTLRLNESLDPFNPAVSSFMKQGQAFFMQQDGNPVAAQQRALGLLETLRHQQALSLSYFDVFYVSALVGTCIAVLVLLMRRSVARKGEHIAAD